MRHIRPCAPLLLILCLSVMLAQCSYGAAQLKAGAKTSAAPTSTNPAERAIQITFDPAIGPRLVSDPGYDVDAFQLSVSYPASLVTLEDINLVSPFQNTSPSIASPGNQALTSPSISPSDTPATGYDINPTAGIISGISGVASSNTAAGPGDVNIFTADFILDPGVSFDQTLNFELYADPNDGDSISGYDPVLASSTTTTAANIAPANVVTTFNEAPEPSCLALGAVGLGMLLRRRKNKPFLATNN